MLAVLGVILIGSGEGLFAVIVGWVAVVAGVAIGGWGLSKAKSGRDEDWFGD